MAQSTAVTTPGSTDYWQETRVPFANLVFVLPWLIAYEAGIWWTAVAGDAARNGADAWLRGWLLGHGVLAGILPLLVTGALAAWHGALKQPWQVRRETLAGMLAESLLFAFVLILCGQAVDFVLHYGFVFSTGQLSSPGWMVRMVSFLGAGIYEEFLFRLCLFPAGYAVMRVLLVPHRWSVAGAVIATSLVFALAHYLSPQPELTPLSLFTDAVARVQSSRELWFGFVFRFAAGIFFATLFYYRGFGITVGCHALYDVVVGVILVSEL